MSFNNIFNNIQEDNLKKNIKLSVAILSYNRPQELLRCMNSLLPLPEYVEVHVFDDCSPKQNDILSITHDLIEKNPGFFIHCGRENVGYDRNLLQSIINSPGDYVVLMSDDDWVEDGCLSNVYEALMRTPSAVSFLRFREFADHLNDRRGFVYRRNYNQSSIFFPNYIKENGNFLYNSILFSGLIFSREIVTDYVDIFSDYLDSIYIQVALFCLLSNQYGVQFIAGPGVVVGADGENGFGLNSASSNGVDLVDRSTVHSNLKFNKRLLSVVDNLTNELGSKFHITFYKEFNFRNISGMSAARNGGVRSLVNYWNEFSLITKRKGVIHYISYVLMIVIPAPVLRRVVACLKKILINNR